jgi:ubiquitin carboxyl-terminal hydrolase 10
MCSVKAVLQLLVPSSPFWDLFRELDDLKGQRGAGSLETGGGATPLVDATVRFFEEFESWKKEPPPPQRAAGRTPRDEEVKKEHNAVPTYMYDRMKEKRQLKSLLVRSRDQSIPICYWLIPAYCKKDGKHQDAEEFFSFYLAALDEELVELYTDIGMRKPASAVNVEDLDEEAQSAEGQTELGKRDNSVRQLFFLSAVS